MEEPKSKLPSGLSDDGGPVDADETKTEEKVAESFAAGPEEEAPGEGPSEAGQNTTADSPGEGEAGFNPIYGVTILVDKDFNQMALLGYGYDSDGVKFGCPEGMAPIIVETMLERVKQNQTASIVAAALRELTYPVRTPDGQVREIPYMDALANNVAGLLFRIMGQQMKSQQDQQIIKNLGNLKV